LFDAVTVILHGYWRSGPSYRVRIALNLKGVRYETRPTDLRTNEQWQPAYRALNAQALVPALEAEGRVLTQSLAILEWLEKRYPHPGLLPCDPFDAATVRAMTSLIACDIHPLNNLRVLRALKHDFNASQYHIDEWAQRWICDGFSALETMIAKHGRGFCFGDTPTFADCALVPQVYSAERFGTKLAAYPRITAAVELARALPPVADAHPSRQPDADSNP
jgi:maleylpyruvate isomerase